MQEIVGSQNTDTLFFSQALMCSSTGINDAVGENTIRVFPNPVLEKVFFNPGNNAPVKSIVFRDLSGRKICTAEGHLNSVDMTQVEAGIYFYEVVCSNGSVYTGKIIKN